MKVLVYGAGVIGGQLVHALKKSGNGAVCDYCVTGNRNPLADEYELITDEKGFLVSRKKNKG